MVILKNQIFINFTIKIIKSHEKLGRRSILQHVINVIHSVNLVSINQVSVNHVSVNHVSVNHVSINHVSINHVSVNHVSVNHVSVNHVSVTLFFKVLPEIQYIQQISTFVFTVSTHIFMQFILPFMFIVTNNNDLYVRFS